MFDIFLSLLLIDNYDFFIYNLVQYFGVLGCELMVWCNDVFMFDDVCQFDFDVIVVLFGFCMLFEVGLSVDVVCEFGLQYLLFGVCLGY